jgi:vacuolar-type H+-ATPase subunit I/STV1
MIYLITLWYLLWKSLVVHNRLLFNFYIALYRSTQSSCELIVVHIVMLVFFFLFGFINVCFCLFLMFCSPSLHIIMFQFNSILVFIQLIVHSFLYVVSSAFCFICACTTCSIVWFFNPNRLTVRMRILLKERHRQHEVLPTFYYSGFVFFCWSNRWFSNWDKTK